MIHTRFATARRVAGIVGLAAVAACAVDSPTSPSIDRAPGGDPLFLTYDYSIAAGLVKACNFSQGVGFTVPSVTFVTSATAGATNSPVVVPQDACEVVWSGTGPATVTVVQQAMAGLSTLRIAEITPTSTIFTDNPSQPATEIVDIAAGSGAVLMFKNAFNAEPPPPPPPPPPPGNEGCTPGFWKNSTGSWVGYTPGQTFVSVFGVAVPGQSSSLTLLQAISLGGGGANALARHAVAGLLAAAHPDVDYPIAAATIISQTAAAISGGSSTTIENLKTQYDTWNNAGCPLDNDNSF